MLEAIDRQQLERFLAELPHCVVVPAGAAGRGAAGAPDGTQTESRRFARKPMQVEGVCEVLPTLPAIERRHEHHRITVRDFSRAGLSFWHCEQLFPDERVIVWTPAGKLTAVVCRCRKRGERGYEIGAKFG